MNEKQEYGFCPGCGALMRDGECTSCGYCQSIPAQGSKKRSGNPSESSGRGKILAGILIGALSILAIEFMIVAARGTNRMLETIVQSINAGNLDLEEDLYRDGDQDYFYGGDDYGYDDFDQYEYDGRYGVTPDAEYYRELTDSIDYKVDYSIDFQEYTYQNEEMGTDMYVSYVSLGGTHIPKLEEINKEICYQAQYPVKEYYDSYLKKDLSEDSMYFVNVIPYVTYNDQEKISIVLSELIIADDNLTHTLKCLNIDLITGEILDNQEILSLPESFAAEFRERSREQNGDSVNNIEDRQLQEALQNPNGLIVFYTPLGMEVGINYTEGWVTVTFKDYEKYLK